ncbi:hypothetical protein Sango_2764800 [Sesamum angolense]|uniref:Uncharacterized protein n=1 Tax=Sesamum angolense TaxID=2727404 RepID=A0AAE1T7C1_9LAMI|nr:hypothetical protein Sango_2764800 [Sesamum angolense]
MRTCHVDAGPSSYCYGGGPYNYESGLAGRFYNIMHDVDHPLWNDCTQSQLSVVAELADIKTDDHIFKQIYDRIPQWANIILPSDHTLPGDYYSTKKLIKNLDLPVENMVIPDPSNPKRLIDVYLEPLIEELLQLWHVGVRTYGHSTDNTFMMRAALMWTVNNLLAYGIASV